MSSGFSLDQRLELADRLVVAVEIGEVEAELQLRHALERRGGRDAAVELDRLLGVVLLLGHAGKLDQHHVAVGLQRQRILQIEPHEGFAAAAVERAGKIEQKLAGAFRRAGRQGGRPVRP